MCLACEQDSIWLAYLESKGLLRPDDPDAVDALFSAFPVQPLPLRDEVRRTDPAAPPPARAADDANKNPFSCDDPTAG